MKINLNKNFDKLYNLLYQSDKDYIKNNLSEFNRIFSGKINIFHSRSRNKYYFDFVENIDFNRDEIILDYLFSQDISLNPSFITKVLLNNKKLKKHKYYNKIIELFLNMEEYNEESIIRFLSYDLCRKKDDYRRIYSQFLIYSNSEYPYKEIFRNKLFKNYYDLYDHMLKNLIIFKKDEIIYSLLKEKLVTNKHKLFKDLIKAVLVRLPNQMRTNILEDKIITRKDVKLYNFFQEHLKETYNIYI